MGLQWSEPRDAESTLRLAVEDMDCLVWETDDPVTCERVRAILRKHGALDGMSMRQVNMALKNKRAEQEGKSNFFKNKGVGDMFNFHSQKQARYSAAASWVEALILSPL